MFLHTWFSSGYPKGWCFIFVYFFISCRVLVNHFFCLLLSPPTKNHNQVFISFETFGLEFPSSTASAHLSFADTSPQRATNSDAYMPGSFVLIWTLCPWTRSLDTLEALSLTRSHHQPFPSGDMISRWHVKCLSDNYHIYHCWFLLWAPSWGCLCEGSMFSQQMYRIKHVYLPCPQYFFV